MPPCLLTDDISDGGCGNPESDSQFFESDTSRPIVRADITHVFIGELCRPLSDTMRMPFFRNGIGHIIRSISKKKMRWIDTDRIVAAMKNPVLCRVFSFQQQVCDSGCQPVLTITIKSAISGAERSSQPRPTLLWSPGFEFADEPRDIPCFNIHAGVSKLMASQSTNGRTSFRLTTPCISCSRSHASTDQRGE